MAVAWYSIVMVVQEGMVHQCLLNIDVVWYINGCCVVYQWLMNDMVHQY
jgi:hypothetical protein